MDSSSNRAMRLRLSAALGALAMLAGCGGGGGGGGGVISTPGPAPTPSPSPAPAPSPAPTPTPTFDTAEYRRSDGPAFHNAPVAWTKGATGAGVKIAVVDTGIDTDSPEFAGRIDPASADVAGNGTVEASDDHGTQVAMTAAAARDNTGILGIAYNATVLAVRTDTPGSCAKNDCTFSDTNIAKALDLAVGAGATVINLSLGGDAPTAGLLDAVRRATSAGVVLVVSAGNEGDGSDPAVDPNNPNPFAAGVRDAGGANVIIVGSVNDQGQLSSFSNKAGNEAQFYLAALGEGVCCVYKDGVLQTQTDASGTFVTVVSGTSFSAPQVSGAVALLKQAFPNLTGAQMVELLLRSARDAGASGTDAVYGRGILDIGAAFAPQGATTLAGGTALVRLGDDTALTSAPMGDAAAGPLATVVTDGYGRAYGYDLAGGIHRATIAPRLLGAIDARSRQLGGASKNLAMAFTVSDNSHEGPDPITQLTLTQNDARAAKVLAARIAMQFSPHSRIGFAFRERPDSLVAQLQGRDRAAFLIAGEARGDTGFAATGDASLAWRQELGAWGLTASASRGQGWLGAPRYTPGTRPTERESHGVSTFGLSVDRQVGNLDAALALTWLNEDRTVLGAYFADAFGAGGARTLFVDADAGWRLADGWRIGAAFREGWTRAERTGLVMAGSNLVSRAWSADLTRIGVFGRSDSLGLRIAQPLRVESGGLSLLLPVDYSYATLSPTYASRRLGLAPQGRELDGELAWQGRLLGGSASASLFYRREPGNVASLPDDKGVAVKWGRRF